MAKSPNAATLTKLAANYGTEPLIVVEIYWGDSSPVALYCDRDFEDAPGKIISLSGLDSLVRIGRAGSAGSLSIELDDTDGSILAISQSTDIHKRKVKVYQAYGSLALSDKMLLLTGEINTPIRYNHTSRTISFDIVSTVEGKEIGFSPEQGDLDELGNVAESAIGKAWPLCFGNPIRVPAVKLTEKVRGTSLTRYGLVTVQELEDLCARAQTYEETILLKEAADTNPGFSDTNYGIRIDNCSAAAEAFYDLLESLINDSPTQEGNLKLYAQRCRELYLKLNEFDTITAQYNATSDQINVLATTIPTLQAQVLVAEQNLAEGTDVEANSILLNGNPPVFGWTYPPLPTPPQWVELVPATAGLYNDLMNAVNLLVASSLILADLSDDLTVLAEEIDTLQTLQANLRDELATFVIDTIVVDGGENFPQGETVQIVINGLYFQGSFSGRVFTVTEANLPADTSVPISAVIEADNRFTLDDTTYNLKGKFCYIHGKGIVLAGDQVGSTILFQPVIWKQTGALQQLENVTVNGQPVIREIYDVDFLAGHITETSVLVRKEWIDALRQVKPDWASGISRLASKDYSIEVGDEVYLATDYSDIYVANLIPSTSVKEVMAYRLLDGGVRKLVPIPSRYYSINLSDSIAGQTPTTITFNRPLTEYVDENWEEQLYVTLVSTEGPNTADVLAYLVNNYTNLDVESSSFSSVATAIDAYPSHFALLEKVQALPTIEDIAFQARCAILVRDETAYIKYLAAEESAIKALTESDIETGSLVLEHGETEKLVTRLTGTWKADLSAEEDNKVVFRNNVEKYGLLEESLNIYIYNSESFVVKTITYWGIQYSNTWKYLRFTGFLNTLALDIEDTVTVSLTDNFASTGAVKARVKEVNYDSSTASLVFLLWLSVRAGEMTAYPFAFPATATLSLEYPTVNDPYAGSA